MNNYFIEIFGFLFIILISLVMFYFCLIVVEKILGNLKHYKEEINDYYLAIKANTLFKKAEIDKIKNKIIGEMESDKNTQKS